MSLSQTEELKRLRSIVKTLGDTCVMTMHPGTHKMLVQSINGLEERIADLEAQQQKIDPFAKAKAALFNWVTVDAVLNHEEKRSIYVYVQSLKAKVDELHAELRCEQIDGGKVRDDLRAEIAELKAKADRMKLEWCEECGHPLSSCGSPSIDGTPTPDCKVCQLRARIAEMERHGTVVDQANHEHYGRLQDQIAIRDLKIEKLEGQLAGRPISEAAEALVKEVDDFKQRENLAELTTILNAIPPACGLARELVEKRIEQVKREVQGNGN